jgi:small subunit ribosomal protein S1
VLEEELKEVRQQILDRLQPGLVVEGQISNIVDFGAFVDLDGIDGLIHISELSWSHVNHPSEILSIGDTVSVKVLDIDRERQRISLGLKQTQEDPWQRIVDTYTVGDELQGKVTKVVTFGAFVEILDGVEGLVHISELAAHHVESPREIVQPGDEIRVKILEIDSERRRLSLSAKRVEDQILPVSRAEQPEPEAPEAEASEGGAEGGAEGPSADAADTAASGGQQAAEAEVAAEGTASSPPELSAEAADSTAAQASGDEAAADQPPRGEDGAPSAVEASQD